MARYIKANPKVVEYLNLGRVRNRVKDGNYLLWQNDILQFGPLSQLSQILTQIGAIVLMPSEARQEQDGTVTRELPEATDERFYIPCQKSDEDSTAGGGSENSSDVPPIEEEGFEEEETDDSGSEAVEVEETVTNEEEDMTDE